MPPPALATTVIGSYPQPDWLIDRDKLRELAAAAGARPGAVAGRGALPREAQDDATALAIADQERAGLDIVSDGEIRRESYSNRFATALEGLDIDHPAMVPGRAGGDERRAAGGRQGPAHAARRGGRSALPAQPDAAHDQDHAARAVHDEPAGRPTRPTTTRPSSPWTSPPRSTRRSSTCSRPAPTSSRSTSRGCSRAPRRRATFALPAIDRALAGATGTTALHTCFGYAHVVHERPAGYPFLAELADCAADVLAIEAAQPRLDPAVLAPIAGKTVIVGVLDLARRAAETPEQVAERIEARSTCPGRAAAGRPRLRHEVPLARARLRQAAGARGGRAARARAARLARSGGDVAARRAPRGARVGQRADGAQGRRGSGGEPLLRAR